MCNEVTNVVDGERAGEIRKKFLEILTEQMGSDQTGLVGDVLMRDTVGLDSLDEVEVLMAVEEEFDIQISDEDAEQLVTLDRAVEYITTHTA